MFSSSILIQFFLHVCNLHYSEGSLSFSFLFFFPPQVLVWSGRSVWKEREKEGERVAYIIIPAISLKWLKLHRSSTFILKSLGSMYDIILKKLQGDRKSKLVAD